MKPTAEQLERELTQLKSELESVKRERDEVKQLFDIAGQQYKEAFGAWDKERDTFKHQNEELLDCLKTALRKIAGDGVLNPNNPFNIRCWKAIDAAIKPS